MQIGIPAETHAGEARVAATPETVKKLADGGHHRIVVQAGAGIAASVTDAAYKAAGATIVAAAAEALGSEIVLKVRAPDGAEIAMLTRGAIVIGLLNPYDAAALQELALSGVAAFAMEWLPRTTRAQAMDVLSSQANIAGYKAVPAAVMSIGMKR